MAKRDTLVRCILQGRGTGEVVGEKFGSAPRKEGKTSQAVVSCRWKVRSGTPEKGKNKSSSGELPMESPVGHHGKREKQVKQW